MADEKSFLQNIKLEISRSFKLIPYERIAFHRILAILKSEAGFNILVNELDKGGVIRESAVSSLVKFKSPNALLHLVPLLNSEIPSHSKIDILKNIAESGTTENIRDVIGLIESHRSIPDQHELLRQAFSTLGKIGAGREDALNFILSIITSDEPDMTIFHNAIGTLYAFRAITTYEELLKKGDDATAYSVYKSINIMSTELASASSKIMAEEKIYTYSSEPEDKLILDIRVLLGKMSHRFDSYSNTTKVAFISSMISCNHREFLVYTMKALTSQNHDLVSMTLYAIYANISVLRDPDKLLRSLIAISTESEHNNELIVDIFVKFFSSPRDTRQFHIMKDKLYSYIVVTLETYFESYRRDFMITNVAENSFPENFQKIRKFILEKCTPEIKKKIVSYLMNEDSGLINHIINDMSEWIKSVDPDDRDSMRELIESMMVSDKKSREIAAGRIDSINFEKRYLRFRITRLCRIISRLHINDAASPLVNIYNYLKKYPDKEIMGSAIHTLATLNYSYMLGEVEVLLNTGDDEEQKKALELLSLFYEQRSFNVLFEFLQSRIEDVSENTRTAVGILIERDIHSNATAAHILKKIAEHNPNSEIQKLAILGIGKCSFPGDMDYLNTIFLRMEKGDPKDSAVRAIGYIMLENIDINKRQVVKYLQEYLKDPDIKVRTYSCILLVKLGNRDAVRAIRDMLVIKNKDIQRDILDIIRDLKSIEFSFFLLTLLKEEYGISIDIISAVEMLPVEDRKEMDNFIVNIFRKFESPEGALVDEEKSSENRIVNYSGLREEDSVILRIDISGTALALSENNISDSITLNLKIKELILKPVTASGGIITATASEMVIAYFSEPMQAVNAASSVMQSISVYNQTKTTEKRIYASARIVSEKVSIVENEILFFPEHRLEKSNEIFFTGRILADQTTMKLLQGSYSAYSIPDFIFEASGTAGGLSELAAIVNFNHEATSIIDNILKEEDNKKKMQEQIEAEIRKMKLESRSTSSVAIARELDEIGEKLKNQLDEIEAYIQRRATDREMIKTAKKMLSNIHNMYQVEISRLIIK